MQYFNTALGYSEGMLKCRYLFTARKNIWTGVVFVIAILMLLADICHLQLPRQDILYYNETASLPRGIYLRIPAMTIERGDIVVYDPPAAVLQVAIQRGYTQHSDARLLKRVGAVAGDAYSVGDQGSFCINGEYIGQMRQTDSLDRPLPQLPQGSYTVPDGEFLPIGDTTRSFDGRYTGTVPLTSIRAVVIPIFTRW